MRGGGKSGTILRGEELAEARAFARAWRERRMFNRILASGSAAPREPFPYRDHRTCAEWMAA